MKTYDDVSDKMFLVLNIALSENVVCLDRSDKIPTELVSMIELAEEELKSVSDEYLENVEFEGTNNAIDECGGAAIKYYNAIAE